MTAKIIDGKSVAHQITKEIREQIKTLISQGARPPGLAVILVGNDPASEIYVLNKRKACEALGIQSFYHHLEETITEAELTKLIHQLNRDENVDGILLQLPIPSFIDTDHVLEQIDPQKDVDGFHPYNVGRLALRTPVLRPCTPHGIITLLDHINQIYKGKHAVIVGASNIVGRPLMLELLIKGCTVTICHRFTENLDYFVKQADILISAVGKPNLIKAGCIKKGAAVIDVGIIRLPDGTIRGDIPFEEAKMRASWITPVPGGVGPMTVAMLMQNTLIAYRHFHNKT